MWVLYTFYALLIWGWILNIADVCQANLGTITGVMVVKIIGIFIFPVGSFMGWFY
jgi:hypothetical protein